MSILGPIPGFNSYAGYGVAGATPSPPGGGKLPPPANAGGNLRTMPGAPMQGDLSAQLQQMMQMLSMLLQSMMSGALGDNGQQPSGEPAGGAPGAIPPAAGETPPAAPPAGGEKPPAAGETPPAAPPAAPPAGGEKPPAAGETPPAAPPAAPPAGGEKPPAAGETPPAAPPAGEEKPPTEPPAAGEAPQGSSDKKGGPITDEELEKATGGNKDVKEGLKKLAGDPEASKVLRRALDNGVTYVVDEKFPSKDAATKFYPDGSQPPQVILKTSKSAIHTLAHESGHAAPGFEQELGSHEKLFEWAFSVGRRLGDKDIG